MVRVGVFIAEPPRAKLGWADQAKWFEEFYARGFWVKWKSAGVLTYPIDLDAIAKGHVTHMWIKFVFDYLLDELKRTGTVTDGTISNMRTDARTFAERLVPLLDRGIDVVVSPFWALNLIRQYFYNWIPLRVLNAFYDEVKGVDERFKVALQIDASGPILDQIEGQVWEPASLEKALGFITGRVFSWAKQKKLVRYDGAVVAYLQVTRVPELGDLWPEIVEEDCDQYLRMIPVRMGRVPLYAVEYSANMSYYSGIHHEHFKKYVDVVNARAKELLISATYYDFIHLPVEDYQSMEALVVDAVPRPLFEFMKEQRKKYL